MIRTYLKHILDRSISETAKGYDYPLGINHNIFIISHNARKIKNKHKKHKQMAIINDFAARIHSNF